MFLQKKKFSGRFDKTLKSNATLRVVTSNVFHDMYQEQKLESKAAFIKKYILQQLLYKCLKYPLIKLLKNYFFAINTVNKCKRILSAFALSK